MSNQVPKTTDLHAMELNDRILMLFQEYFTLWLPALWWQLTPIQFEVNTSMSTDTEEPSGTPWDSPASVCKTVSSRLLCLYGPSRPPHFCTALAHTVRCCWAKLGTFPCNLPILKHTTSQVLTQQLYESNHKAATKLLEILWHFPVQKHKPCFRNVKKKTNFVNTGISLLYNIAWQFNAL